MIYKANNIAEAVDLAHSLKQSGKYNWFRGQICNWPLKSSFLRISEAQREIELQKLARFNNWVKKTEGLQSLATHADSQIAVAQHYGLPTNFIDFTTNPDIAGFFAAEGEAQEEKPSCIMCLDTNDLSVFWQKMPAKYPPPEFLELEVANLWRLESQFGVFLFCPYESFEFIYDLDRILFPYTGAYNKVPRHQIYPNRKSQLEILLDQYFMNETLIEGTKAVRLMHINMCFQEGFPDNCNPDFLSTKIDSHDSWGDDNIHCWFESKKENYFDSITNDKLEIVVTDEDALDLISYKISSSIIEQLSVNNGIRKNLISWKFKLPASSQGVLSSRLTQALSRLWDGLRTLPYSDADIAKSIGNCVALYFYRFNAQPKSHDIWLDTASLCFGECIEVEFGSDDGSYSRGYVSSEDLLQTVRGDIYEFISEKHKKHVQDNITGLLQAIQSPQRLFDFSKFTRLFSQQIVPTQVIVRTGALFYSPARLTTFGLP